MKTWRQGGRYRDPNGRDWVVQTVYEGPGTILGMGGKPLYCPRGVVVLASHDMGTRLFADVEEARLKPLEAE